jgi:hypothetical protein
MDDQEVVFNHIYDLERGEAESVRLEGNYLAVFLAETSNDITHGIGVWYCVDTLTKTKWRALGEHRLLLQEEKLMLGELPAFFIEVPQQPDELLFFPGVWEEPKYPSDDIYWPCFHLTPNSFQLISTALRRELLAVSRCTSKPPYFLHALTWVTLVDPNTLKSGDLFYEQVDFQGQTIAKDLIDLSASPASVHSPNLAILCPGDRYVVAHKHNARSIWTYYYFVGRFNTKSGKVSRPVVLDESRGEWAALSIAMLLGKLIVISVNDRKSVDVSVYM